MPRDTSSCCSCAYKNSETPWDSSCIRNRIAPPRLVHPKVAVRVSDSHKEPLWKGNQAEVRRGLLSGLGDDRVCKCVFQSYSSRTREHKLPSIDLAEWMVA